MKCPGCDYIVLLNEKDQIGETKEKDSRKNIWIPGKNGSSKLDIDNIEFYSDYKCKWPYKSMQSHVTNCEPARQIGVPTCFGKKRRRKNQSDDGISTSTADNEDILEIPPPRAQQMIPPPPAQQIQAV
jgi:hypothetical protein